MVNFDQTRDAALLNFAARRRGTLSGSIMMTATAVYPLSRNAAFTPEVTNAMGIREASTGERDPNRLFTAALKGLSV